MELTSLADWMEMGRRIMRHNRSRSNVIVIKD